MEMLNSDGSTRLESAKKEISDLVDKASNGSTFTLVVSDSNSRTLCQNIQDKDVFNSILNRVDIDYSESSLENAISLAQSISSNGKGSHFSLFTDKEVKVDEGIETYNVADTNNNYAISDFRVNNFKEEDVPYVLYEADVVSYSEDASLEVEFFLDDKSIGKVSQDVKQSEVTTVSLKLENANDAYTNYSSLKAVINNKDYLKEDSEYIIYNSEDFDTTEILIVSNSPFYFESVFNALNSNNIKIEYQTVTPAIYSMSAGSVGYDIVVFDGYAPEALPVDSAVWLFNCGDSIPNSGFYFQKEYTVADPGIKASYANNNDDLLYQELTKNLVKRDITIKTYLRYTLNSKFTTILSYDNLPFIFAGRNGFNQKEIVFNFDLHNSNFPLLADFIILMRNCIRYSNPSILDKFNYNSHDDVVFTFPDTALSCEITTPSGAKDYLSTSDLQSYTLDEVGTYSITVELVNNKTRKINIFSSFPVNERVPVSVDENTYSIIITADAPKADFVFNALLSTLIVALILLLADWMLYSHEQF